MQGHKKFLMFFFPGINFKHKKWMLFYITKKFGSNHNDLNANLFYLNRGKSISLRLIFFCYWIKIRIATKMVDEKWWTDQKVTCIKWVGHKIIFLMLFNIRKQKWNLLKFSYIWILSLSPTLLSSLFLKLFIPPKNTLFLFLNFF